MSIEDILEDAKAVVKKVVPDHVDITQIDFEGPVIVIYTKNMEAFAESNDIVRQLAQNLRRRIQIRPDPSVLPETPGRQLGRGEQTERLLVAQLGVFA
ncbi:MAG: hypothetical protein AABX36_01135 [Candidatus Thermoplasmatota archaeon]